MHAFCACASLFVELSGSFWIMRAGIHSCGEQKRFQDKKKGESGMTPKCPDWPNERK